MFNTSFIPSAKEPTMYAKVFRATRKSIIFPTFESFTQWQDDNDVSFFETLTATSQSMVNNTTGERYIVKFY